jgi:hypothetical protein
MLLDQLLGLVRVESGEREHTLLQREPIRSISGLSRPFTIDPNSS